MVNYFLCHARSDSQCNLSGAGLVKDGVNAVMKILRCNGASLSSVAHRRSSPDRRTSKACNGAPKKIDELVDGVIARREALTIEDAKDRRLGRISLDLLR